MMTTKICDMEIKDTCLNKLCSIFEVDITKIEAPVRFCLGAIPKIATRWNSTERILQTDLYIFVTILLLSQNNYQIWNLETQTLPKICNWSRLETFLIIKYCSKYCNMTLGTAH